MRADSPEAARARLRHNLTRYALWRADMVDRIIPVIGDLSQPCLGLSTPQWQSLADSVDVMYHSAAALTMTAPYSALQQTNVCGTHEILRLACTGWVKPLHYVSTLSVFDAHVYTGMVLHEDEPLAHSDATAGA